MDKKVYENMKNLGDKNWWFSIQKKIVGLFLDRNLTKTQNHKILDVGCGTGRLFKELSLYGDVFGIEIDKESSEFCNSIGYKFVDNETLGKTNFTDEAFDTIVCTDVLEHIENDLDAIHQCFRLLNKDGFLFITVPVVPLFLSKNEKQYGHFRRYDFISLIRLLKESGFDILETTYFNIFLMLPIIIIRKITDIFFTLGVQREPMEEINLPSFLNKILKFIFNLEFHIIKHIRIPYGLSLLVVAKK